MFNPVAGLFLVIPACAGVSRVRLSLLGFDLQGLSFLDNDTSVERITSRVYVELVP